MLLDILQILAPVGVYPIGRGLIPTLRCFGPIPRDSSEGFLVTFTPGFVECIAEKSFFAILSALSVSHELSSRARKLQQDRKLKRNMATCPQEPIGGFPPSVQPRDNSDRSIQNFHSSDGKPVYFRKVRETPEEEIRIDLMTPANYTYEPLVNWYPRNQLMRPFGKGRITLRWWIKQRTVRYTRLCAYIKRFIKQLKENTPRTLRQGVKFTLTQSFGKWQLVTDHFVEEVRGNNLNAT